MQSGLCVVILLAVAVAVVTIPNARAGSIPGVQTNESISGWDGGFWNVPGTYQAPLCSPHLCLGQATAGACCYVDLGSALSEGTLNAGGTNGVDNGGADANVEFYFLVKGPQGYSVPLIATAYGNTSSSGWAQASASFSVGNHIYWVACSNTYPLSTNPCESYQTLQK